MIEAKPEGVPEFHTDSDHPFHKNLYRTLVLLAIDATDGPVYFVVEGLGTYGEDARDLQEHTQYFYEEHTCPTNFVGRHSDGYGVAAVYADGNRDPHGVFRFVRAVWMPQRYVDAKAESNERRNNMGWEPEDVMEELFPELVEGCSRRCIHEGKAEATGFRMSVGLNGDSTMTGGGTYTHTHYVEPGETCNHPDRITR